MTAAVVCSGRAIACTKRLLSYVALKTYRNTVGHPTEFGRPKYCAIQPKSTRSSSSSLRVLAQIQRTFAGYSSRPKPVGTLGLAFVFVSVHCAAILATALPVDARAQPSACTPDGDGGGIDRERLCCRGPGFALFGYFFSAQPSLF